MYDILKQQFAEVEQEDTIAAKEVGFTSLELDTLEEDSMELQELEAAYLATSNVYTTMENLRESVEGEPMDEHTARYVHGVASTALKSIYVPFGDLPSKESFADEETREEASRFTTEALSESLKQLWKGLVEFMKKLVAKGLDVLMQVKKRAAELEAKAAKYGEKAANMDSGLVMKNKTLDVPGKMLNALTTDGKTLNLVKDLQETADYVQKGKDEGLGTELARDFLERITAREVTADTVGKFEASPVDDVVTALTSAGYKQVDELPGEKTEGMNMYFSSAPMMGNSVIAFIVESKEMDGKKYLASISAKKVYLGDYSSTKDVTVDALEGKEMVNVFEGIGEVCTAIVKAKAGEKEVSKLSKDLIKAGDKLVKDVEALDGVSDTDMRTEQTLVREINSIAGVAFQPSSLVVRCAFAAATASYRFADMSYKNYQKAEAA